MENFIPMFEDTIRIYFKENGGTRGFKAHVIELDSWSGDDPWNFPERIEEVLFQIEADFDGVRHLYMGSEETDNYGYLYYPNIHKIIEIFKEIEKLQIKYCNPDEL